MQHKCFYGMMERCSHHDYIFRGSMVLASWHEEVFGSLPNLVIALPIGCIMVYNLSAWYSNIIWETF